MGTLRDFRLEDLCCQSALQKLGHRQSQHVVETLLILLENAESDHAVDEGLAYRLPPTSYLQRVFWGHSQAESAVLLLPSLS